MTPKTSLNFGPFSEGFFEFSESEPFVSERRKFVDFSPGDKDDDDEDVYEIMR